MGTKMSGKLSVIVAAVAVVASVGCAGISGPNLGVFGVPVPVSPFFQDKKEDEFWMKERYTRVPVLGPLTSGGPVQALDPPSDDEVMRALERAPSARGWFAVPA